MEKLTVKERISITARGYKVLKRYCPGFASGKAVSALISAIQPFASIWFSAQIINELTGSRRVNLLVLYVCAVLFINFIISMLRSVIDRITGEKQAQMWDFFQKVFTDKQLSMDYVDLENGVREMSGSTGHSASSVMIYMSSQSMPKMSEYMNKITLPTVNWQKWLITIQSRTA